MSAAAPRALFFDLDGTLVDSAPDLVAAVQALCAELGVSWVATNHPGRTKALLDGLPPLPDSQPSQ